MSTEPLLYFLQHSAVFVAVPAVLFYLLGYWAGRGKRPASALEKVEPATVKTAVPALAMLAPEPVPTAAPPDQESAASPAVEAPATTPATREDVIPEETPRAAEITPDPTPPKDPVVDPAATVEANPPVMQPEPVAPDAVRLAQPLAEATPEAPMTSAATEPAAEESPPLEAPVSLAATHTEIPAPTAPSTITAEKHDLESPAYGEAPEAPVSAQLAPAEVAAEATVGAPAIAPVQNLVLPPVEDDIPLDLSVPELPADVALPTAGRLRARRPARMVEEPVEAEKDDRPFGFLLDDADDDERATKTALAALLGSADASAPLATTDAPTPQKG